MAFVSLVKDVICRVYTILVFWSQCLPNMVMTTKSEGNLPMPSQK